MKASKSKLNRQTFQTSRVLDFFSRKGLIAQTGHDVVIGTEKENTIGIEKGNADRNICSLEGRWPA